MWVLGSVRIFVTDKSDLDNQIIARLQPLSGGTVHQVFGYENEITTIKFYVVGNTDVATLKGYRTTGSTYTLSGWGTNYGNFYIKSLAFDSTRSICQTLRPDLADDAPVFLATGELYA